MKVLFVSSGNTAFGVSPITRNQGNSLEKNGINVFYFPIYGKGLLSYLKNVFALNKYLSNNKYDVVHAHYSLSAYVATLSGAKPLVVSLMGSDVKPSFASKLLIKFFSRFFWHHTIVKSAYMRNSLGLSNASVFPNGVDTDVFYPMDKLTCAKQLGWDIKKKHILFAAKPSRPEKNFALAEQAVTQLDNASIKLHTLIDVPHERIPLWLNATDVVLLTSLWEGSPNVIKEAMACNRPIVATDVGDISWLFGDEPGHYLTTFADEDVAAKLRKALAFSERIGQTKGRMRIIELGLDSAPVAKKIADVYQQVLYN